MSAADCGLRGAIWGDVIVFSYVLLAVSGVLLGVLFI